MSLEEEDGAIDAETFGDVGASRRARGGRGRGARRQGLANSRPSLTSTPPVSPTPPAPAATTAGGADGLPEFFKLGDDGQPLRFWGADQPPPGGGGLEEGGDGGGLGGGLGDEDDEDALGFGDAFDIPLAGLPEFFTSTDGSAPPVGATALAATLEAAAEYDMLADITGEESGARAALGLTAAGAGAPGVGGATPAAAQAAASSGGWDNLPQLQAAYLVKWQETQVRVCGGLGF